MAYKYAFIATDGIGYTANKLPGPDDGKPGMAGTAPGDFGKAYEHVKGAWNPVGFGIMAFDTMPAAQAWQASPAGVAWLKRFDSVILARLLA